MKTQKLTLAAVLATTLLSTSAFADMTVKGDTATGPTITLSLDIAKSCNIHGLNDTNAASIDVASQKATLEDVYAECNTGTVPKISFSSTINTSATAFKLTNEKDKTLTVPYTIALDGKNVTPGVNVELPTKIGANLDFAASYSEDKLKAGNYSDTLTTTITM